MNVAQITAERDRRMQLEQIKKRSERVRDFYNLAIKLRKLFDEAVQEGDWDNDSCEDRMADVVFGDGESDAASDPQEAG